MIQTIVIPTKGRPATLKRALTQYIGDAQANVRDVEFVVVDGATNAADRNRTKEVLKALEHETRVKVRYLSNREVGVYAKQLGDAGKYLGGKAIGAIRNAALLDTTGQKIMFVDDDTLPKLARRGAAQMALFRDNRGRSELATDPSVFSFYDSRGEALTDSNLSGVGDVVATLSSPLGMAVESLWPLLRDQGVRVKGDRASGTVLASNVGVYGDPAGLSWGGYPELLGGLTRAGVRARASIRARGVFRAPVEEVIQSGPHFPTHAFALDNTKVLPPFAPFENSGDGLSGSSLYGHLLGVMFSNAFIAFRPWAIYHDPPGIREYADHVVPFGVRDLVVHAAEAIPVGPRRLQRLGEALEALEGPSGKAWVNESVEVRTAIIIDEINTRAVVVEGDQLCDNVRSQGDEFPRDQARRELIEFGKLIQEWPGLVASAKVLKEQNIRASVEL